jgi:hypothetical protein
VTAVNDREPSWQEVAIELIRRRAGHEPRLSAHALERAGQRHFTDLSRKLLDSLYLVTCELDHPKQRMYQALWDAQRAEAREVVTELVGLGIDAVAFKGVEIGARYDRGRAIGMRADVDLLVPREALWTARQVLSRRGYVQGSYRPETRDWGYMDPIAAAQYEATHYELLPFAKAIPVDGLDAAACDQARNSRQFCVHEDVTLALVMFDVHHNLSMNFDPGPVLERRVPSALGVGSALCAADHLWFMIQRHYTEVAMGIGRELLPLASIAAIVRDPDVDWSLLLRNAQEHRAIAACYYWLTFFQRIAPGAVPSVVLDELRRHRHESPRDWGWQLGPLFDIEEPFPVQLSA